MDQLPVQIQPRSDCRMQLEEPEERPSVKEEELTLSIVKEEESCTSELSIRSPELDLLASIPTQTNESLKQKIQNQSSISNPSLPAVPPNRVESRSRNSNIIDMRTSLSKVIIGKPKGPNSRRYCNQFYPDANYTNADLTTAIQQVLNKNMTMSQASQAFGVPYHILMLFIEAKFAVIVPTE
ncbi:hypothetical protein ABEB36_010261 [Hypothenemus hampei]|uniref:HTH psq-type domain-containing protein n=1 Tax=Hypothenemus hampei TaxID=57062 RepID=A0ABD1EJ23_HYPHA